MARMREGISPESQRDRNGIARDRLSGSLGLENRRLAIVISFGAKIGCGSPNSVFSQTTYGGKRFLTDSGDSVAIPAIFSSFPL
jgi:hypothetical protein